jgi:hypothetical protein
LNSHFGLSPVDYHDSVIHNFELAKSLVHKMLFYCWWHGFFKGDKRVSIHIYSAWILNLAQVTILLKGF